MNQKLANGFMLRDCHTLIRWGYGVLIVVLAATSLSGCGVMYLDAPPASNIRLLSEKEKAEIKIERHAWFKYWGAEPIDPNAVNASKIIEEQGLKEARIQMTNTFVDGLYSIIPGIFGFPRRTLVVEGNRTLHSPGSLITAAKPSDPPVKKAGVAP